LFISGTYATLKTAWTPRTRFYARPTLPCLQQTTTTVTTTATTVITTAIKKNGKKERIEGKSSRHPLLPFFQAFIVIALIIIIIIIAIISMPFDSFLFVFSSSVSSLEDCPRRVSSCHSYV